MSSDALLQRLVAVEKARLDAGGVKRVGENWQDFALRFGQDVRQGRFEFGSYGKISARGSEDKYKNINDWAYAAKGRKVSVKPHVIYKGRSLREHEHDANGTQNMGLEADRDVRGARMQPERTTAALYQQQEERAGKSEVISADHVLKSLIQAHVHEARACVDHVLEATDHMMRESRWWRESCMRRENHVRLGRAATSYSTRECHVMKESQVRRECHSARESHATRHSHTTRHSHNDKTFSHDKTFSDSQDILTRQDILIMTRHSHTTRHSQTLKTFSHDKTFS